MSAMRRILWESSWRPSTWKGIIKESLSEEVTCKQWPKRRYYFCQSLPFGSQIWRPNKNVTRGQKTDFFNVRSHAAALDFRSTLCFPGINWWAALYCLSFTWYSQCSRLGTLSKILFYLSEFAYFFFRNLKKKKGDYCSGETYLALK